MLAVQYVCKPAKTHISYVFMNFGISGSGYTGFVHCASSVTDKKVHGFQLSLDFSCPWFAHCKKLLIKLNVAIKSKAIRATDSPNTCEQAGIISWNNSEWKTKNSTCSMVVQYKHFLILRAERCFVISLHSGLSLSHSSRELHVC